MFVQMLGVFAEFERATIIDRVIAGMERKAATGAWTQGGRPFGYELDRESGFLRVREEEAALVPMIFDLYVNKLMGARAIANRLNQHGHVTRKGKPWSAQSVLTILNNRVYIGEIFFRDRHHKAPHPPLVGLDTFEAAQAILLSRSKERSLRRSNTSDYLLTGLVVCQKCGKKFVGAAANGRNGRYPYYVCFSRQRYGPQECDQDRLPSSSLEERVVESLSSTFSQRDLLEEALEVSVASLDETRPKLEREFASVDKKIRGTEGKMDRYFNAFEAGTLSEKMCGERIEKLTSELVALESRRSELRDQIAVEKPTLPGVDEIADLCDQAKAALEGGSLMERKSLLQKVIKEVRVTSRSEILPVFWVPLDPSSLAFFRPPYGLVELMGFEPMTF